MRQRGDLVEVRCGGKRACELAHVDTDRSGALRIRSDLRRMMNRKALAEQQAIFGRRGPKGRLLSKMPADGLAGTWSCPCGGYGQEVRVLQEEAARAAREGRMVVSIAHLVSRRW